MFKLWSVLFELYLSVREVKSQNGGKPETKEVSHGLKQNLVPDLEILIVCKFKFLTFFRDGLKQQKQKDLRRRVQCLIIWGQCFVETLHQLCFILSCYMYMFKS